MTKELERSLKKLEIGGIDTAFQKTAPKPKGEEIDARAGDSKARQKRKKGESPANGGEASKEDGVFDAVRSRRPEGGSSSNGAKGASSFSSAKGASSSSDGLFRNSLGGFGANRKSLNSSELGGVGGNSSNGATGGSSSQDSSNSKFKAPPPSTRKNYTSRGERDSKWSEEELQHVQKVIGEEGSRETTLTRQGNLQAEAQPPAPGPSPAGADGVGGEKNGLSPSQG